MTDFHRDTNRSKSLAAFAQAQRVMPGGVNSPARAYGAVGGTPLVLQSAKGPYVQDVDGNRLIDFVGSWGPMILGHAPPKVVKAIQTVAESGTSFGAPTLAENQLAGLIIDSVSSVEKVRLVNSGTEATMSAVRLARGFTGRDLIVKFSGNYHGHVDSLLVAAGSAGATLAAPNSPGVTTGAARDTLILPYNDAPMLRKIFQSQGERIAAVIFEPVCGNMGVVPPRPDFLESLHEEPLSKGALLICDEVMTGFRLALGGAQERFGISPDLTTLGKIVGGGLPVGAYGGRAAVMDHVLPVGKVFQAGTLSGNPLATAAGLATLTTLRDDPPYERLEALSARLEAGFRQAADKAGVSCEIARVGSMLTLFFSERPIANWEDASQCDTARFARFFWAMLDQGVYLPCSQYEAMFVSAAHTEREIDSTIAAAKESIAEAARAPSA